jgi:hypothetical protein
VAEVIMWEVPLLAVISELVHRYRSPEISVDLALETLEHKLADFAQITAGLDMPLPPDGLRHPPSLLAKCSRPSSNVCSRSRGLSAPATTIWRAASSDANGHPGA